MGIVTALELLQKPDNFQIPPVCVVFGEEAFLRSKALRRLRSLVLSDDDGEFSLRVLTAQQSPIQIFCVKRPL